MDKENQNKRIHPRIPVNINVISMVKVNDEMMHLGQFGSTVNLSLGGVLFQVNRDYEAGSKVKLSLQLEGKLFDVHGEVVRTIREEKKVSIAVKFTSISEEGKRALANLLREYGEEEANEL